MATSWHSDHPIRISIRETSQTLPRAACAEQLLPIDLLSAPVVASILAPMRRLRIVCVLWMAGCGFQTRLEVVDAGVEVDASLCFDGFTPVCLQALPTMPLLVESDVMIDTATGCETTTMDTAPGVCVVAATTIEIRAGVTLRAIGPRPLLLLATDAIVVAGTLDAGSHRDGTAGPGANFVDCRNGMAPTTTNGSGGGGHGGTFGTVGGDGGASVGRGAKGVAPTMIDMPAVLRGGCPGIAGADTNPGVGGAGGGAVELNAPTITVSGVVNASGAGGQGGTNGDSGGGGGGSGGMIVFDAPTLMITGMVMAQGGGGGGGSGDIGSGTPGSDPHQAGVGAAPGLGYTAETGRGGAGGAGSIAADGGDAQDGEGIGGGGGGGGAGVIRPSPPG
jgi:hypothetical protein